MTALLHTEARNVLNLLLLHLSTHKTRVLAGVKIVAGIKRSVSIESEEHIVRTLMWNLCVCNRLFRHPDYCILYCKQI